MGNIVIPIFMYHQIDLPPARKTPFRSLTVAPENFARQMRWLKRFSFQGLSVRDLLPYLRGEKQGKVVGITFDDGYRNVYDHALPVLQELGFTATNFFVSRQIDGHNEWDEEIGMPYSACMSKSQVREWAACGYEVGAHTLDHMRLTQLPQDQARRQIVDSRAQLEDITGQAVTSFSYPWGDVSDTVRNIVQEAGYSAATTTRRGRARPEDDYFLLPRRNIKRTDGWLTAIYKCMTP